MGCGWRSVAARSPSPTPPDRDATPARRATVRGGRWAPSRAAVTTLTLTAKAAWSGRRSRTCAPRWAAWSLQVKLPGAGVLSLKRAAQSPIKAAKLTVLSTGVAKIIIKPTKDGLKMLEQMANGKPKVK